MAERSKKNEENLQIKIGNLMPGDTAVIKYTVAKPLEVAMGSYSFVLPQAFYPDYAKHGM